MSKVITTIHSNSFYTQTSSGFQLSFSAASAEGEIDGL